MAKEHLDVVVIGAGLSGIGAACHLNQNCPGKTVAILEGRDALGGTWDLFKYPGIRSDSDMFTLGYNFKPWTSSKYLADGPSIKAYITEAAQEHGVEKKIRYGVQVKSVNWDTPSATWTITYLNKATGETQEITCSFIFSCTGYYSYEGGYEPDFPGKKDFKGEFIHPQKWPENLDYSNKKVVVIGSGATAVTLVPEMAKEAAQVTMLQRSPTYMATVPDKDKSVEFLRKYLPNKLAYRITRTQKVAFQYSFYQISRKFPKQVRNLLLLGVQKQIGNSSDLANFKPKYNPWDERLCAVKDGDLFRAVRKEQAKVVTDTIEKITENGIQLNSGEFLDADIIVSATGLNLEFFGGIDISVDSNTFDPTQQLSYKGIMVEQLPNIGFTFGYTNASWTLKADITAEYLCRLINHMDKTGTRQCMPANNDPSVGEEDFLDFQSGYVQRGKHKFPLAGNKLPWKLYQSYPADLMMLRYGNIEDGVMQFSNTQGSRVDSAHANPA